MVSTEGRQKKGALILDFRLTSSSLDFCKIQSFIPIVALRGKAQVQGEEARAGAGERLHVLVCMCIRFAGVWHSNTVLASDVTDTVNRYR